MTNKNNKGFTLLELLIAMSIASLIAMAFFSFLNSSIKYNKKNEVDIKALNMAQSEIENLRNQIKSNENISEPEFTTIEGEIIVVDEDEPYPDEVDGFYKTVVLEESDGLYTVEVKVKQINDYYSKKETRLITKVFGG